MRGHVDPETLAASREGLLRRRKARQVAAHLAECQQCAGLDTQLAGLPALLAHAPAPPMPDALTARIEAALAAEAAARPAQAPAGIPVTEAANGAGAPSAGTPGSGAGGRRRRPAAVGRSRLALRIAVAAAAVVVIAGGGYGVSRLFSGSGALTGASSSAGSGANGKAAAPSPERLPGAPAAAPGHSSASGAGGAHTDLRSPAGYLVVASGTDYRASQLKSQVRRTLIRYRGAVPAASNATATPAHEFGGASSCLAGVTAGQRPRLVDVARYEGKPATVIVVPAGTGGLRALVFAGHCPATGGSLLTSATLVSPG